MLTARIPFIATLVLLAGCSVVPPQPGYRDAALTNCKRLDEPDASLREMRECASQWRTEYLKDEIALRRGKRKLDVGALGVVAAGVAAATYGAHVDVVKGLGLLGGTLKTTGDYFAPATRAAAARLGVDGMTCVLNASAKLGDLGKGYEARASVARPIQDGSVGEIDRIAKSFAAGPQTTAETSPSIDEVREAIYRVHAKVVAAYTFGAVDGAAFKAALEKAVGLGQAAEAKARDAATASARSGNVDAARAAIDQAVLARAIAEAYVELEACGTGA